MVPPKQKRLQPAPLLPQMRREQLDIPKTFFIRLRRRACLRKLEVSASVGKIGSFFLPSWKCVEQRCIPPSAQTHNNFRMKQNPCMPAHASPKLIKARSNMFQQPETRRESCERGSNLKQTYLYHIRSIETSEKPGPGWLGRLPRGRAHVEQLAAKRQSGTVCAENQAKVQRMHDAPPDASRVEPRQLEKWALGTQACTHACMHISQLIRTVFEYEHRMPLL